MSKGVITQVREATKNPLALVVGCLLGGFIPLATYTIAHNELKTFWSAYTLLVVGGLLYSAKTVYQWAKLAFDCTYKAIGFVILLEGVMTISNTHWLSLCSLVYLVGINAIATGCQLARRDSKDKYKIRTKLKSSPDNDVSVVSSKRKKIAA